MCKKIGLSSEGDGEKADMTAALLRSRRHKSPEKGAENVIVCAYQLSDDDRAAVAAGEPLYVGQVTYGRPPFAQIVHVGTHHAAEYYAVDTATPELLEKQRLDAVATLASAWERYQKAPVDDGRRQNAVLNELQAALQSLGDANQAAGFGA